MKDKDNKIRNYVLGFVAFIVMIGLVYLMFGFVNGFGSNNSNKKYSVTNTNTPKTSPKDTVNKFILSAGNIGDITKVSYSNMVDESAKESMKPNRLNALYKAQQYIADDSKYMINYSKSDIENYLNNLINVEYFSIDKDSIFLSNPQKTTKTKITTNNGDSKFYDTVTLNAQFTSKAYTLAKTADDASWDGSYNVKESDQQYNNVKFTLINQDSKWKIYNVSDLDNISTRFATWQPASQATKIPNYTIKQKLTKGESLNGIK
jgi:hypothetical protein